MFLKERLTLAVLMMSLTLAGIFASNSASAAPIRTFSGLLAIGDNVNNTSDLVGVFFSIDGDSTFDLNFAYAGKKINSIFGWDAFAREASPGSALIFTTAGNLAKLFSFGESIGPGGTTTPNGHLGGADTFGGSTGNFLPDDPLFGKKRGFIGFSFLIGGATHYGWADVEVDVTNNFEDGFLNVYGYGYETTPNTAILAGAGVVPLPAAAWLFISALGFLGLTRLRRSEVAAAS